MLSADCTPAIQRALDDASAAGGRDSFPAGGPLPPGGHADDCLERLSARTLESNRSGSTGSAGTILMIQNQEHEQSVLLSGSGCWREGPDLLAS